MFPRHRFESYESLQVAVGGVRISKINIQVVDPIVYNLYCVVMLADIHNIFGNIFGLIVPLSTHARTPDYIRTSSIHIHTMIYVGGLALFGQGLRAPGDVRTRTDSQKV